MGFILVGLASYFLVLPAFKDDLIDETRANRPRRVSLCLKTRKIEFVEITSTILSHTHIRGPKLRRSSERARPSEIHKREFSIDSSNMQLNVILRVCSATCIYAYIHLWKRSRGSDGKLERRTY